MKLKTDKVIYHVETFEDAKDLAEKLDGLGCEWVGGGWLLDFEILKRKFLNCDDFCIRLEYKKAFYDEKRYYEETPQYQHMDIITYKRDEQQTDDRKEKALSEPIKMLEKQYKKGLFVYQRTIAECNLTPTQLFKMAQEELADGLIYVSEALKRIEQNKNGINVDIETIISDVKSVADSMHNSYQKDKLLNVHARLNEIRKGMMTHV